LTRPTHPADFDDPFGDGVIEEACLADTIWNFLGGEHLRRISAYHVGARFRMYGQREVCKALKQLMDEGRISTSPAGNYIYQVWKAPPAR